MPLVNTIQGSNWSYLCGIRVCLSQTSWQFPGTFWAPPALASLVEEEKVHSLK